MEWTNAIDQTRNTPRSKSDGVFLKICFFVSEGYQKLSRMRRVY
jgi:hypothetical protein